jgi:hypothetical protein
MMRVFLSTAAALALALPLAAGPTVADTVFESKQKTEVKRDGDDTTIKSESKVERDGHETTVKRETEIERDDGEVKVERKVEVDRDGPIEWRSPIVIK